MKKIFIATAIGASLISSAAIADDNAIKLGIILGFTGPIESLTPNMAKSGKMAWKEVTDSKLLLGGKAIIPVEGDSTCVDSAAATAVAEKQITSDKVAAIFGADCSGVTGAIAKNVATPNGVVLISPSATSPALSTIEDKGFFFRTAPSDARQGEILSDVVSESGVKKIAVTYTNNDYGKGLAESFKKAFIAKGGKILIEAAHEDGKADYSAEVGALAASGAETLAVFGYVDQGGKGIVQTSLDNGAFSKFVFADGMIGEKLFDALEKGSLDGNVMATRPGSASKGNETFLKMAKAANAGGDGPFDATSYDAAAIIALAIQAAGSADRAAIQGKVMDVANAPGEKIYPGELAKALKILADGGAVNYEGASAVEFNEVGEVFGSYRQLEVKDGKFTLVKVR